MSNLIFLIPPSEGKNSWWMLSSIDSNNLFIKPKDISIHATEKDLKCTWKRYEQWILLNTSIFNKNVELLSAIDRYSWVMYNAINYSDMSKNGKIFFEDNFLILSGMHGLLKPLDTIGNYKLPIETKGLYGFWWEQILETINALDVEYVVNLLPISYAKLIYGKNKTLEKEFTEKRRFQIININFLKTDGSKMAHGVKRIKGEWIHDICNKNLSDYRDFWGQIIEKDNNIIDINIVVD